jgi:hypothetical protein
MFQTCISYKLIGHPKAPVSYRSLFCSSLPLHESYTRRKIEEDERNGKCKKVKIRGHHTRGRR